MTNEQVTALLTEIDCSVEAATRSPRPQADGFTAALSHSVPPRPVGHRHAAQFFGSV